MQHLYNNRIKTNKWRIFPPNPVQYLPSFGSYKSAVTKHAHRLGFEFEWQTRFYDHIIRNDESFQKISNYINNNTANWQEDKFIN
ncbi:MAG TPA: hypothetical protein PKN57_01800 [Saprospiraceae bacterium]|nr:hypothetical protein [Saprospiraceae bacterium]HMX81831.1 hypothetical protein [Saprospiraceae bacterium]HMZ73441.1 hypothetical protein [Saprospiraceae bacterium]HNE64603.1 hypothetical protein [Saprospiraceae bacterium]HNL29637.1 hypothetical protein [Saprospiraceae bacterium]